MVEGASETAAGAFNVDGVTVNVVGACMVVAGAASVTGKHWTAQQSYSQVKMLSQTVASRVMQ